MRRIRQVLVLVGVLAMMSFAVGCDGGSGGGGCDGGSSGGGSGIPELDASHRGWQQPNCAACHDADSHNAGLAPYQCVDCHGTNGAPNAPHNGNCQTCHRNIADHPQATFPYNTSCQTCH
jgi:hypothetical protein